jgi:hypothetical protein
MSGSFILWGYKPDGSARVFRLNPGDELPPGWTDNVYVIQAPELRTGDALSNAAGDSVREPIPVSHAAALANDDDGELELPLQYDEDNQQVVTPVKRKIR